METSSRPRAPHPDGSNLKRVFISESLVGVMELLIGAIAYGILLIVIIGIAITNDNPDLRALTSQRRRSAPTQGSMVPSRAKRQR